MKEIGKFKEIISKPQKVVVLMHPKPDADALGSTLALTSYLTKKGHSVTPISPTDYPNFLNWLPGNESVLVFQKESPQKTEKAIAEASLIFCLDFNNLSRIFELGDMVRKSSAIKVLIDHHLEPEQFADFEQWDGTAASTAELVYQVIHELEDDDLIDQPIAENLYAGLMTDTGGFRHSNTSHKVFLVAAELVAHGAEPAKISKLIYDTNSLERLRLMGFVLAEKLQVLPEYNTAYIVLTADELKKFSSQTGDTEGLVNYGLSVKGVSMAALIYQRKDMIKLSFRSFGKFSVNDFARKHFNGGGHKNAAGGQSDLTLDQTIKKFLDLLPEYQAGLNSSIK